MTSDVLLQVADERDHQDAMRGVQSHPSIFSPPDGRGAAEIYHLPCGEQVKADNVTMALRGVLTWADIAIEELVEAVEAMDEAGRREELVQLAAVVVAWIECIDRRTA